MLPRRLAGLLHTMRIAGIERTPPLTSRPTGLMYMGMVCRRDVRPWLVAVKSVALVVGEGEFAVINDGSLTPADRGLLSGHLPGLRILNFEEVVTTGFPRGNTWERLLAILDLSRDRYVVQVDADLVARSALPEVVDAIQANRSFTLAGEPTAQLKSLIGASEQAHRVDSFHVQWTAERYFDEWSGAEELRYVRGCSGFAGFPNGCDRGRLAELSQFMQHRMGERWHEWGSEQVASNFVIANSVANPLVLPWERYPAFGQVRDITASALVRFVGSHRYENGVFTRTSQSAIERLSRFVKAV